IGVSVDIQQRPEDDGFASIPEQSEEHAGRLPGDAAKERSGGNSRPHEIDAAVWRGPDDDIVRREPVERSSDLGRAEIGHGDGDGDDLRIPRGANVLEGVLEAAPEGLPPLRDENRTGKKTAVPRLPDDDDVDPGKGAGRARQAARGELEKRERP